MGVTKSLRVSVSWKCCLSKGSGSRVSVVGGVCEGSRSVFKVGSPGAWVVYKV